MIKMMTMRVAAIFVALAMIISIMPARTIEAGGTAPDAGGADGSSLWPYIIDESSDLTWLSAQVNGGNTFGGKYFLQTADIDMSTVPSWTPIGTSTDGFCGNYDGNGHTISRLTCSSTLDNVGLFGYIGKGAGEGSVQNLTLSDFTITNTAAPGAPKSTAALAGSCYGSVTNCHVSTSSVTCNVEASSSIGGLVGQGSCAISRCSSSATILSSYSLATLGGIIGSNSYRNIENCLFTGAINHSGASAENGVGGIAGYMWNASVKNCCSRGTITTLSSKRGGIVGNVYDNDTTKTFVLATDSNYFLSGTAANGYGSYYTTGPASPPSSVGATAKTADQLKTTATFTSTETYWDFTSIWKNEVDGTTYPYLRKLANVTLSSVDISDPENVVVSAVVNSDGGASVTERGAEYIRPGDDGFTRVAAGSSGTGSYTVTLSGLPAGIYAVRAYAVNVVGAGSGGAYGFSFLPSGSGLEDDPYVIDSAGDLNFVRYDLDAYYRIDCDLDLSGTPFSNWTPIGTGKDPFTGTLDGNGKVISGFTAGSYRDVSSPAGMCSGLFCYIDKSGTVMKLGVNGAYTGAMNMGGIVAYNLGTISQCYNRANMSYAYADISIGGIVGYNEGTIEDCYNTGDISTNASTAPYAAGIVAWDGPGSEVTNCYNTGSISVGANGYAAGIVGCCGHEVTGCFNTGTITGSGASYYLGGVAVGVPLAAPTAVVTNCDFLAQGSLTIDGKVGTSLGQDEATYFTDGSGGAYTNFYTTAGWVFPGTWTYVSGGYPVLTAFLPSVSVVSPSAGPTAGGTAVTITGTGFTDATAVKFGATVATSFTVNSSTRITATAPAGAAGTVDITVTTAMGTSATGASDRYTYVAPPTVASISPVKGPTTGGTAVTITGTNLTGASAVTIGGASATGVTVVNSTTITATTPAGSAGAASVVVTTPGGTATGAGLFTYVAPPTVTGISPSNGPTTGGTSVTITGTNLTDATAVTIGGTPATDVIAANSTTVTATTPVGSAGAANVAVTTPGGTGVGTGLFTYVAIPTVTSISPTKGPVAGGTSVTITGTNFAGAPAVTIGGTSATDVTVINSTTITATTPAGSAGAADVVVTTPGGTATGTGLFTYVEPPTVTVISPTGGPIAGSTSVTITGTNFTGPVTVTLGGTSATGVTVVNSTTITATTPAGSAGAADVVVTTPGGTATGIGVFTYIAPPAVISVSSGTDDGTYGVNDTIDITVGFDAAVSVTGAPQLTLETGATDRTAAYVSGSGTATLAFSYTVQSGDTSSDSDLDYVATTSLTGTIKDLSDTVAATLTLPDRGAADSLGANKDIVIDGIPPSAPSVTSASPVTNDTTPTWTWTSEGGGNGTYRYRLDSPDLASGATSTTDTAFTPGSGLPEGDHSLYVQELDNAGNWSASGSYKVTVDTTPPSAPPVTSASSSTYDTTPTWTWTSAGGGNGVYRYKLDDADLTSGATSGAETSYTPGGALGEGNHTLYVQETDDAGNWSSSGSFTVTVDTTPPSAPSVTSALSPTNDTTPTWTWTPGGGGNGTYRYKLDGADLTSGASSGAETSYTPDSALTEGDHILFVQERDAAGNWSLSGSFTVTVDTTPPPVAGVSDDETYNNDVSPVFAGTATLNAADFVSGTTVSDEGEYVLIVTDEAGNSTTVNFAIDKTAPHVDSIDRQTPGTALTNSDSVVFRTSFSEAVTGVDKDDFSLATTGTATGAVASVSAAGELAFDVTVNTIAGTGTLRLDLKESGTGIADIAGTAMPDAGFSGGQTYAIDRDAPVVISVAAPDDATYLAGQNLDFTVNFSEAVTVDTSGGTPYITLTLNTGGAVSASYISGSGSTDLGFKYTVTTGDLDDDGVTVGVLSLNGGTIRDASGNGATLTLNNVASTAWVRVDAAAPTVSSVRVPANGTYVAGQVLDFTVNFDEAVTVDTSGGTPAIALILNSGGTVSASYTGGSDPITSLTFGYTVATGDMDADGVTVGALSLNGGTIRDASGNGATLTLNNVASTAWVRVDAVAPTVSSVSVPAGGTYVTGQNLDFRVNFAEAVTVDTSGGTPYISLAVGSSVESAAYFGGSGSSALTFRYVVASGDADPDGVVLGTEIALGGGAIVDTAGNDAVLAFPDGIDTTGIKVDTAAPAIVSAALSSDNTYMDITFSEGVYGAGDGSTALMAGKLSLTFTQNTGEATNVVISSVKKADGLTEGSALALTGGETVVRVFLSVTGTPTGFETIEIKPASGASIYDAAGNAMETTQTTGVKTLIDMVYPVAGGGGTITVGTKTSSSVALSWTAGTDSTTAQSDLKYRVVYSTSDDIATVSDAQTNGIVAKDWTAGITSATVTGLSGSTDYYFNVLVKDAAGNVSAYTPITGKTLAPSSDENGSSSTGTGAIVEVNGESYSAGQSEAGTNASGQTVTTVTVDTGQLQNILENQGAGATVTIPVTTGSQVVTGVLTGEMINTMEQNGATLVVQTESATYTLPANEININDVSAQFGEDVSLSDITVTVSISEPSDDMVTVVQNAADSGGYTLVVPAVEFSVTCTYGDETVSVSSFNGYVERTIAIPDGVDPSMITTAVVVDPDGTTHSVPTQVVEIDGRYYAVINSLTNSVYSVIYNHVEFADVTDHWAKVSINDMGSRLVVGGDGDGNFRPESDITRAEFAAILVRALGLGAGTGETAFSDVKVSDWYSGYVGTASAYGLVTGYPDGTFRPNDRITREQAMVMLARAMKTTKLAPSLSDSEIGTLLAAFPDAAGISDYAEAGVAACIRTGVVAGMSDGTLAPTDYITRAQAAVTVERLLENSGLI